MITKEFKLEGQGLQRLLKRVYTSYIPARSAFMSLDQYSLANPKYCMELERDTMVDVSGLAKAWTQTGPCSAFF